MSKFDILLSDSNCFCYSPKWTNAVLYRVRLLWSCTLVGMTMIFNVPPPCPVDQPILPNSHLPMQNQADRRMRKN